MCCFVEPAAAEMVLEQLFTGKKTPNALFASSPPGQLQNKLKEWKRLNFPPFLSNGPALHRSVTNECGQKAESEQQKICLNRASSVMVLMRSRGSTSAHLEPPSP